MRGRRGAAIGVAGAVVVLALVFGRSSEPPVRAPSGVFVPSVPGKRAVIWAVGDGADGSVAARRVAARIGAEKFDRFLYLGDVYDRGIGGLLPGEGDAGDFRSSYSRVYGRFATRTAPTLGNHEAGSRESGYQPYWSRIHRRPAPDYYALRAGGWELLSLNSEVDHDAESAQLDWLRARLRSPGTCRLAFWHRPRYSGGRQGDQRDVAALWDALRGRAAIVVNGHEHAMQRMRPIDGLAEYVSGAGGHGHHGLRDDPRLAFGDDEHDGALRIELRPGRAQLRFVAADGEVLDSSRVRCRRSGA